MSTPDPVPTPTPETPAPCQHQFGGDHASGTGYSCKLCGVDGEYNSDKGEIVAVTPAA